MPKVYSTKEAAIWDGKKRERERGGSKSLKTLQFTSMYKEQKQEQGHRFCTQENKLN